MNRLNTLGQGGGLPWIHRAAFAAGVLSLFWLCALIGNFSPAVLRLHSSVAAVDTPDYGAGLGGTLAPLDSSVINQASNDQNSSSASTPASPGPSGGPGPSPSPSASVPFPTPTLPGPTPTLPIPTPTLPVPTPTLPVPTPTPPPLPSLPATPTPPVLPTLP